MPMTIPRKREISGMGAHLPRPRWGCSQPRVTSVSRDGYQSDARIGCGTGEGKEGAVRGATTRLAHIGCLEHQLDSHRLTWRALLVEQVRVGLCALGAGPAAARHRRPASRAARPSTRLGSGFCQIPPPVSRGEWPHWACARGTAGLGPRGGEEVQHRDHQPAESRDGRDPKAEHPPDEHLALVMQVGPELTAQLRSDSFTVTLKDFLRSSAPTAPTSGSATR